MFLCYLFVFVGFFWTIVLIDLINEFALPFLMSLFQEFTTLLDNEGQFEFICLFYYSDMEDFLCDITNLNMSSMLHNLESKNISQQIQEVNILNFPTHLSFFTFYIKYTC